ncbi:MAG TPA: hypothetical protein VMI55_05860 [Thermoplasmata archaeon]|nr:hypothetical protein [Thermoplasmata archaeon]
MSSALVLGTRGSGLTTFVGLLYTAQVRLGTQDSDEFRFHADRESIRQLEAIYGELGAGRFPVRDANWEEHPVSFVFAFRHGVLRGLGRSGGRSAGGFDTVRVQVGGMPTDEVAELREHDAVLEESTRRLLRSQVILPLIDATSLDPEPDPSRSPRLSRDDRVLAETLDLLGGFLAAEPERRSRRMYPVFIVTKVDEFSRDTLRQLEAPSGIPGSWTREARRAFGGRLLNRYFPLTARFLETPRVHTGLTVAPSDWFFSSLSTEDSGGDLRIERRSLAPAGGWEPEYPFEEYRALIGKLGQLAHRLPADAAA